MNSEMCPRPRAHSTSLSAFVLAIVIAGSVAASAQIGESDERVAALFHTDGFRIPVTSLYFDSRSKIESQKSSASDLAFNKPLIRSGGHFESVNTETRDAVNTRAAQTQLNDDRWHFGFAPYFYLTGISGTVGARGRQLNLDASFGNVWENLDVGLMGTFEARKNRFVFLNDLIWVKLSQQRNTPGPLFSTAKVGINLFILDPEAGYRVLRSDRGSLDILGGLRIWSVETNVNVTTGLLAGFDVSERKTWAAPVIGLRGLIRLSSKFYFTSKFDIGGGIGADFTTQVFAGVGYRITPHIALVGGYRYLLVDYDNDTGFIFNTRMNGFVFGVKFDF